MIFQDNVIKKYLSNVYFITGTPCGGKTTVAKALSEKHGIPVYDIDEMFALHQQMSDNASQPNMNRQFKDADEFFGRSVDEYVNWLIGNTREQLDFVLLDLIRLSQNGRIICDCHLTLEEAKRITEPSKVVFLVREPYDLVDEYCARADHKDFSDFIHSASDFEKAKAVCSETLCTLNKENYNAIKISNYFWLERSSGRTVEDTVKLVEKHFGFETAEDAVIEKV